MTPKIKTIYKIPQVNEPDALIKEQVCPICGTTENLLVNGYCIDFDEELTNQIK
jgi:hypothetical protein